jgi:hypothetical protein
MLELKGTINSITDAEIPIGCVIKLAIIDVSKNLMRLDQIPIPLKQMEIYPNTSRFPVPYTIEFEEGETSSYYLSVSIEKSNKVLFNNLKPASIIYGDYVGKSSSIRHHLDVYLYETNVAII